MATKVLMEALSPTMEEGRLVEWKKAEGAAVKVGEILAEVETDKAVMDLQARAEGVLLKQAITPGTTVPVGQLVGVIGSAGEDIAGLLGASAAGSAGVPAPPPASAQARTAAVATTPGATAAAAAATPAPGPAPTPTAGGRVKASPLARRMAADRGVDLAGVQGSGPEGRIVVREHIGGQLDRATSPVQLLRAREAVAYERSWGFGEDD